MFEVIMLFALMFAALCQLIPERSNKGKVPDDKKDYTASKTPPLLQSASKQKPLTHTKNRSHSYACAA